MGSDVQSRDASLELERWLAEVLTLARTSDALDPRAVPRARDRQAYLGCREPWRAGMFWTWAMLVLGPVLTVLVLVIVGLRTPFASWEMATALLALLPLPLALSGAGVIVALRNRRVRSSNARRRRLDTEYAHQIEKMVAAELHATSMHYRQTGVVFRPSVEGRLLRAQVYERAVEFCLTAVRGRRATTLSEAIELYETELRPARVTPASRRA